MPRTASDHQLLEWMPDGVLVVDAGGLIVYANRRAEEITGYCRDELRGQPIELLVPQRFRARHKEHRRDFYARLGPRSMGEAAGDFRVRRKDGSELSADISLGPVAGAAGPSVVAVIRDMTERQRFEAQLQHEALHDPLTGLANRTLFFDRLSQAILSGRRDGRRFALAMLDLDRFKCVNDAYGHATGDEVLKQFAARLAAKVRNTDTAARLGGDEFACIFPRVADRAAADQLLRLLLRNVNGYVSVDRRRIEVNASAGMALYPDDGDEIDSLMRRADRALYSAKPAVRSLAAGTLAC